MDLPYKYFKYWAELIDFMNVIASSLAVLFASSIYFLSVDIDNTPAAGCPSVLPLLRFYHILTSSVIYYSALNLDIMKASL